jgi:MtfA peptidase
MPFDTTIYITTYNEHYKTTLTVPGGKDTAITLRPWELPSHAYPPLAGYDDVVRTEQRSLAKAEQEGRHYIPDGGFIIIFILVFVVILYKAIKEKRTEPAYSDPAFTNGSKPVASHSHKYYGDELNFPGEQLSSILIKRFPYYKALSQPEQEIFLDRLQKFMADKTFKIHGEKAYKEMPVLISAAAIQLTFGLKKFLLPHFRFIHIHPHEFLRVNPILCFLEGNVSGHSINLSWKHFLDGYANSKDGQNVGLHELAHALYYQTFEVEKHVDRNFRDCYDDFNVFGDKAYHTEKTVAGGLYSEYAEKNFQEFWAESVEIFFEKPVEMRLSYPQLYQAMKSMLNQDPVTKVHLMGG